jgi:prophage regulatory protein
MTDNTEAPSDDLLRLAEVERRVGLKKTAIYERIAAKVFPAPVPDEFGRTARWSKAEIDAYVEARKAARNMGQNMGRPLAA